uniref:Reverse transcriptase zinc-binding domain-containing protein n=1 Tax=Lactuca sativa TaxID=4236 RepID=A0A9R1WQ24_LACSA|nr:hypothetical protein LSAT_V11C100023860 [Lactuca sativa]
MKSIYIVDGGSVAKRKSGCWGVIANLPKLLEKDTVSFMEHFLSTSNDTGSVNWSWSLEPSGSDDSWKWNPLVPEKLNILAWRINHGRLPSMANLSRIGIGTSNLCMICGGAPETQNHIFVECEITKVV